MKEATFFILMIHGSCRFWSEFFFCLLETTVSTFSVSWMGKVMVGLPLICASY